MIGRTASSVIGLALVVGLLLAGAAEGDAQVELGLRAGLAEGARTFAIGELNGRVGVVGPFSLTGGLDRLVAPGACAAAWPESFRCGYSGTGAFVGPALSVLDLERLLLTVGATAGSFWRTNGDHPAPRSPSWSVGSDVVVRIGERIGVQAGVHHRWIQDGYYRELFGETPAFTNLTVGFLVNVR